MDTFLSSCWFSMNDVAEKRNAGSFAYLLSTLNRRCLMYCWLDKLTCLPSAFIPFLPSGYKWGYVLISHCLSFKTDVGICPSPGATSAKLSLLEAVRKRLSYIVISMARNLCCHTMHETSRAAGRPAAAAFRSTTKQLVKSLVIFWLWRNVTNWH